MIGQTIESRVSFPIGAIVCALVAAGLCLLAAVLRQQELLIVSAWPWLVALLRLARWGWEKPFRATFTATGLEVESPPLSLPYAQVQGLLAGRRPVNPYQVGPRRYPIQVIHSDGVVRIPPQLNVRSDEVYSFLYQKLSSRGSSDVHPSLVPYLRYKEQEYGPSRVWSYRARTYRGRGPVYPLATALSFAAVIAGLTWLLVGIAREQPGWIVAGVLGLVLGGPFALAFAIQGHLVRVPKRLRSSSLVICPDGLALAQSDMQGQLRWEEVRDMQVKRRAADTSFQLSWGPTGPGIVLKVAGALIVIFDVFDRPLPLIHQLICHYRRSEAEREEAATEWQFDPALLKAAGAFWGDGPVRQEGSSRANATIRGEEGETAIAKEPDANAD